MGKITNATRVVLLKSQSDPPNLSYSLECDSLKVFLSPFGYQTKSPREGIFWWDFGIISPSDGLSVGEGQMIKARELIVDIIASAVCVLGIAALLALVVYIIVPGWNYWMAFATIMVFFSELGWCVHEGARGMLINTVFILIAGGICWAIGQAVKTDVPFWFSALITSWVTATSALILAIIKSDDYDEVEVLQGRGKF